MRKPMIFANWKMNGSRQTLHALIDPIVNQASLQENLETVILPPALYLQGVSEILSDTRVNIGAQNVYPEDKGAYTGEIATPMLLDFACRYVLVGHSERRHIFGESEKLIAKKFHHVKEHDMIPVLCIGETLEQRKNHQTNEILFKQLSAIMDIGLGSFDNAVIAYEPVWAIGTGVSADPEQAQSVHKYIRDILRGWEGDLADKLLLLYGGSVNKDNAKLLFDQPDIDGGLVGGASLKPKEFVEIMQCIN